ncbi:MAG: GntR family transcriptional regulator [Faecalibacterium sp.]
MNGPFDTSRPIYTQIVERLTRKIIAGEYAAGQRLASVRELASELGVNPNTLQRAFAELERQGLLYTERTAGRFVTQNEVSIRALQDVQAQQALSSFVHQMAQMGYTKPQLIELLQQAMQQEALAQQPQDGAEITDCAQAAPEQVPEDAPVIESEVTDE